MIEAMRCDATVNGGKLPAALSEIQIVPVPLDPMSNQPFKYRLDGTNAVLEFEGARGQTGAL